MNASPASRRSRLLTSLVLLVVGFIIGVAFGRVEQTKSDASINLYDAVKRTFTENNVPTDQTIFQRVWDLVSKQYVKQPVDQRQLFYGAVSGLVNILGDRYSSFFPPEQSAQFKEGLDETSFGGIGAEVGVRNDGIVIIAPLPGTPAERAGLKPEDQLLRIDDRSTADLNVDEAVRQIRGQAGTKVTLTVGRSGQPDPFVVEVVRDTIVVKSVRWELQKTPANRTIAYVQVTHFTEETPRLFHEAVQALLLKQPAGLILDLRNNPGGFLDASVQLASAFVDDGSPIVIERRVDGTENSLRASGTPALRGIKTAVLINEGSASAAEIVAGALQDYAVATLIGEPTFGKGSVQSFEEFSDGSSLKLTVAAWLTPKRQTIDQTGITPDLTVAEDDGAGERILDRAYAFFDSD